MKSRSGVNKNIKNDKIQISSGKRPKTNINSNTANENPCQNSEQIKTMKKSLNNLFGTYSSTKEEHTRPKKSLDPTKKKSSSPVVYTNDNQKNTSANSKLWASRSLTGMNNNNLSFP